eukprot:s822_g6.t1
MKAARKRKKGAGNSQPAKRVPFPELSQQKLDDKLYAYTRAMGIKEAFNLHEYLRLQPQQAESCRSLCKLSKLLAALMEVSPSAKVKYKYLKQSMVYLQQTWGHELLSAHWTCERGLLPGRAADALLVLLNHWRRCTASQTAWQRFCSKLDESQCQLMEQVRKKMVMEKPKRKLLGHVSDVSMDSLGFPAMTAHGKEEEEVDPCVGSAEEEEEEEEEEEDEHGEAREEDEDEKESVTKKAKKSDLDAMESSPPPVVKKDWRAAAGCNMKKPASKKKEKVSGAGLPPQALQRGLDLEGPAKGLAMEPKEEPDWEDEQVPRRNRKSWADLNAEEKKEPTKKHDQQKKESEWWEEDWKKGGKSWDDWWEEKEGQWQEWSKNQQWCSDGGDTPEESHKRERWWPSDEERPAELDHMRLVYVLNFLVESSFTTKCCHEKATTAMLHGPHSGNLCSAAFWLGEFQNKPVDWVLPKGSLARFFGPEKGLPKMAPKKVMKVLKVKIRRPASALGQLGKDEGEGMSLEEKMAAFQKKGNQDVGQFLDTLTKGQREALWQRFSSARASMKDKECDGLWQEVAKGKGSDPAKKKLLGCFLKLGGDLKGKREVYLQELVSYTKSSGALVAFGCFFLHLAGFCASAPCNVPSQAGLCEIALLCQVKRGSIGVRKDPADPAEWQFTLRKTVAWTEEKSQHELKGEAKAKAEASQWLELKAQSLLAEGEGPASSSKAAKALEDVLSKDKSRLAIMDKDPDEASEDAAASPKKGDDDQVVEADLLSDMGGKVAKEEAQVRVKRMVKLLKAVKKDVSGAKAKSLDLCLAGLQKLCHKGKKVSLEEAKEKLFEAALEIKKAKKK